jgi:hypothetical protein
VVFWTKNIGPFLRHLPEVRERGYPFIVQYTINGYPRALETSVVDSDRSVALLRRLHDDFGPRVAVWRYDTILLTSMTPASFHLANFARLARALEGATDEVVISFAHLYRKTVKNLAQASKDTGFTFTDPDANEKQALLAQLLSIAGSCGMRLSICSQPEFLVPGANEARCVDADRLGAVAGTRLCARQKGNREGCACAESRDIGDYDTCPHGCVYCYAVRDRDLALQRFRRHDPHAEFLFPPESSTEDPPPHHTLPLFPEPKQGRQD